MPDLQEPTADLEGPATDPTCDEIARSLGTVWARFSGQRPKSTSVEIEAHTVRCVIEEGVPDPDAVADAGDGDVTPGEPELSVDSPGFQHNASAAVARVMGRRVAAFIPKHDKKTELFTHTFILARPRRKF